MPSTVLSFGDSAMRKNPWPHGVYSLVRIIHVKLLERGSGSAGQEGGCVWSGSVVTWFADLGARLLFVWEKRYMWLDSSPCN